MRRSVLAAADSYDYFDNLGGAGATTCTSKPALPEALARDESDANYDDMARRHCIHTGHTTV